ncbi:MULTISPECIES: hypothetical protein [unclassified Crossiella]|uniref:hypothetical protein n=1 Tax=unclassified Crossiella TaxID=2620835 RepID=UPI001FFFD5EC|nr:MULTISPECIES: hypothetical protein [unclassified Crossiella]MCK2238404.1 hypothetical protein [Crossiella sp. S99.2]MCK2256444.1 hypothetical protein [Crossiella sp. S99.1]
MAIPKGHRFEVSFDLAFPKGLVLVGELAPDNEYQENKNREPRQKVDPVSGLRQWVGTVTDPDETKAKRASFQVTFLAEVQPVPTTAELVPGLGMRQIILEGLTAEPRVTGNGEYKYQGWLFRATGFKASGAGANKTPAVKPAETKAADASKAA